MGRPLGSSNDLTVREASTLLARLQLEPEADAGPAEPDAEDVQEEELPYEVPGEES